MFLIIIFVASQTIPLSLFYAPQACLAESVAVCWFNITQEFVLHHQKAIQALMNQVTVRELTKGLHGRCTAPLSFSESPT